MAYRSATRAHERLPVTVQFSSDVDAVDWRQLAVVFERAPLGRREPEALEQLFRNSQVRCFAYDSSELIGAGRALTDWVNWAIVFDLVVLPEFQKCGHGRNMMQLLMDEAKARNVMLYSSPGKERFYEGLGFRRMKTAMARFAEAESAAVRGYVE